MMYLPVLAILLLARGITAESNVYVFDEGDDEKLVGKCKESTVGTLLDQFTFCWSFYTEKLERQCHFTYMTANGNLKVYSEDESIIARFKSVEFRTRPTYNVSTYMWNRVCLIYKDCSFTLRVNGEQSINLRGKEFSRDDCPTLDKGTLYIGQNAKSGDEVSFVPSERFIGKIGDVESFKRGLNVDDANLYNFCNHPKGDLTSMDFGNCNTTDTYLMDTECSEAMFLSWGGAACITPCEYNTEEEMYTCTTVNGDLAGCSPPGLTVYGEKCAPYGPCYRKIGDDYSMCNINLGTKRYCGRIRDDLEYLYDVSYLWNK